MAADRLVCFDLGRVLVRICDNWQHASRVAGISDIPAELSPADAAQLYEAVCLSEIGKIDKKGFGRAAAGLLGLNIDQIMVVSDAYLLGPFEGTAELIEDLAAAKIATACLSNTNDSHWQIMSDPKRSGGLPLNRLSYRFASHLIGLRKPDAAIYRHVERETGVAGNAITFFDDLEENIAAARQLGWKAHRIDPHETPAIQIRRVLAADGIL